MKKLKFKKICIIGVGMLGGSLGMALRNSKVADEVVGVGRTKTRLNHACAKGAIDRGTLNLAKGVNGAGLVIIATPVRVVPRFVRAMLPFLRSGCLITDVGSTKSELVSDIEGFLPDNIYFVGGHPLVGSEKSGVRFASCTLFQGGTWILTRTKKTNLQMIKRLKWLWETLGARVAILSPSEHDRIVAVVSHLPHLAACSLVSQLNNNARRFVSSGFRDTTRIASGDPVMWRDICLTNRKPILHQLNRYTLILHKIQRMVIEQDSRRLESWFKKIKAKREVL